MTESTIDHANLWNRTSAEFGELVSKYESEDNLYLDRYLENCTSLL